MKKILVLIFLFLFLFQITGYAEKPAKENLRIYCSGPIGGEPDFKTMRSISDALKAEGYKTYLPVDDGFPLIIFYDVLAKNKESKAMIAETKYWLAIAAYSLDVFNLLRNCNAVICNVNPYLNAKTNPDSGSIMELTLSYAFNRPRALYKSSAARMLPSGSTANDGWDNPMIVGITNNFNLKPGYVAASIPDLITNLEKEMSKAGSLVKRGAYYQFERSFADSRMPQQLLNYVNLGEGVYKIRKKYAGQAFTSELALKAMKEVAAYLKANASKYNVADWNGYIPD